jgi:hypothetical protein
MVDSQSSNYSYSRISARVLGCLNNGEITAILSLGFGIFYPTPIDTNWIPVDLRMPNSEFDILVKSHGGEWIRILRKDESCPEIDIDV